MYLKMKSVVALKQQRDCSLKLCFCFVAFHLMLASVPQCLYDSLNASSSIDTLYNDCGMHDSCDLVDLGYEEDLRGPRLEMTTAGYVPLGYTCTCKTSTR